METSGNVHRQVLSAKDIWWMWTVTLNFAGGLSQPVELLVFSLNKTDGVYSISCCNSSSPGICNRLLFKMVQLCNNQYISFPRADSPLCFLLWVVVILSPLLPLHFSSVLDPPTLSSIHSTSSPPYHYSPQLSHLSSPPVPRPWCHISPWP